MFLDTAGQTHAAWSTALDHAADDDPVMILSSSGPGRSSPDIGRYLARTAAQATAALARSIELRQQAKQVQAEARDLRRITADARRQRRSSPTGRQLLQRSEYARLLARLETIAVIEQAKGIVMAQSHCGEAEAFDMLRRASQRSNVPVRDLAAQIVARQQERHARQPERHLRRGPGHRGLHEVLDPRTRSGVCAMV